MIELLHSLRGQVSEGSRDQIDSFLASVLDDVADAAHSLRHPDGRHDEGEDKAEDDEQPGQDFFHENTGVHQPMQAADDAAERFGGPRLRSENLRSDSVQKDTTRFFLDDELLEMNLEVDPFELPPFEKADGLFRTYLEHCHNLFPLLARKTFTSHFNDCYAALASGDSHHSSREWRLQLNLIFAIASVYRLFSSSTGTEMEREHLVYYSRACALNEKKPLWFSRPSLPQVQSTGLLAFYYLITGFIDRSWALSGLALQFGFAIGLHNRSENQSFGAAKKEELARIWWAHFALERLLAAMTGRPTLGIIATCSVPLPLSLSSDDLEDSIIKARSTTIQSFPAAQAPIQHEGSSDSQDQVSPEVSNLSLEPANSGSYLNSLIQLGEITQKALGMYTAGPVEHRFRNVQEGIGRLTSHLDKWTSALPNGLNFLKSRAYMSQRYDRERNSLDILYHSTIILATRPFLCRFDRLTSNQAAGSGELSQRCALTCVESAKAVAGLFPGGKDSDLASLYSIGPWWQLVYTLVQSFSVLLLEVVYEPVQLPHNRREIMLSLKRLLRWLRAMQATNLVAARAYAIVMKVIQALITTTKIDISDLLEEEAQSRTAHQTKGRASMSLGIHGSSASHDIPDSSMSSRTLSQRPTTLSPTHSLNPIASMSTTLSATDPIEHIRSNRESSISSGSNVDSTLDQSNMGTPALSGLFVTIFDEGNPLSNLGVVAIA
ncbi:fungal-specific transcription factor domain-containing protein [Phaeosphaeria sp. MPI-PUGE-AT-0046c]|nr:fungal-specific transcription factor domain-containing protein [Phaeosphaeria sp. MPI-PUGE-AT-0046c]